MGQKGLDRFDVVKPVSINKAFSTVKFWMIATCRPARRSLVLSVKVGARVVQSFFVITSQKQSNINHDMQHNIIQCLSDQYVPTNRCPFRMAIVRTSRRLPPPRHQGLHSLMASGMLQFSTPNLVYFVS